MQHRLKGSRQINLSLLYWSLVFQTLIYNKLSIKSSFENNFTYSLQDFNSKAILRGVLSAYFSIIKPLHE